MNPLEGPRGRCQQIEDEGRQYRWDARPSEPTLLRGENSSGKAIENECDDQRGDADESQRDPTPTCTPWLRTFSVFQWGIKRNLNRNSCGLIWTLRDKLVINSS